MNVDDIRILDVLPHRYPFIMIDKVTGFEHSKWARGYKNVTWNDWFISEANPFMPYMMVVEALAQLGGFATMDETGISYLSSLNQVEMHEWAQPGDRLDLYFEVTKRKRGFLIGKGLATVGDRIIVKAEEIVSFTPKQV
ncbi:3-hydroxyacyl-ACP dehydratase FabZ family protein [Paenibacillus farraposensis]|uniref:3-hydroxyacyl-ACP dehydratase FabZ family protein n=1 Tax=Paenibacillus farraposensis TaxID=2807095 RepID=A0ABW4DDM6_9BACL|nr:3-hydroxyacyl-ACP dehydratase FabZ family protein [Paenibacillus farraposensis]MCC3380886.1 beta-hydroxyacyl-ACP dehydratase [Paenibacillus farraposensis]